MGFVELLLIAVRLAMDVFAVSVGIGTTRQACTPRPMFRLSFHFGLFQALMPIIGWFLGIRIASLMGGIDHWVVLVLLSFVGIRMIRSGLDHDSEAFSCDPSRGRTLLLLALATSIDALAIGLSLAMLDIDILEPSVIIGVVAATLSVVGLIIGNRLGQTFGKRAEIFGGLILIAIGTRVVLSHLGFM